MMNEVSTMASVDQVSSSAKLDESLEQCIKVFNYSKARRLIEMGASVHGTTKGMPYLAYCIKYGKLNMARVLVEHGALNNPSINLESLLHDCRRHGEKQMENVLLQQESTGPEECIQSLLAFLDKLLSETSSFKKKIDNEEIRFTTARRRVERSRYSISRDDELRCIVDPRNGELISQRKINLYVEFIEEVERHARSFLKYFNDQPEQMIQYAQNH